MTGADEEERLARAALTCIAEPGDPVMGALLRYCAPAAIMAALIEGRLPVADAAGGEARGRGSRDTGGSGDTDRLDLGLLDGGLSHGGVPGGALPEEGLLDGSPPGSGGPGAIPGLARALRRWGARLGETPTAATLAAWQQQGIRLLCPGDPGWPSQLEVLGDARPWALWLRGNADLRYACLRSVSVVGSRAATGYGAHVGGEMAAVLAEHGWGVVSGGALGIDSWAHRGALAAEGVTIAVLASGVDAPYPPANHDLFRAIAAQGAIVSEWPPGRTPTRPAFLVRNQIGRAHV